MCVCVCVCVCVYIYIYIYIYIYLPQRAGTAEPSYTLHCRLQLSDRHPAYYPNWPIYHFRRQDWGQCSQEVFLRLSELYDEPWYGVYMTAMTINMSRHALSHVHHEMWRHKDLSNWKRHVTEFHNSVHIHQVNGKIVAAHYGSDWLRKKKSFVV